MLILDTNVISELFKPAPAPQVSRWVAALPGDALFTTAITRGELLFGVHRMPKSKRKTRLLQGITRIFQQRLAEHVLPYDSAAADAHAALAAARLAQGRPMSQSDAMIAGIALSRKSTLATRNTKDFETCGLALVNPWE